VKEPRWVSETAVRAFHEAQLHQHGGELGVLSSSSLESALDRARNLFFYQEPEPDLFDLAAAYAFGLAKNHAFVDGNKRTSLATTAAFLELNGQEIVSSEDDLHAIWLKLAAGEIAEKDVAAWLRLHCKERGGA
jgi:death on curing protein